MLSAFAAAFSKMETKPSSDTAPELKSCLKHPSKDSVAIPKKGVQFNSRVKVCFFTCKEKESVPEGEGSNQLQYPTTTGGNLLPSVRFIIEEDEYDKQRKVKKPPGQTNRRKRTPWEQTWRKQTENDIRTLDSELTNLNYTPTDSVTHLRGRDLQIQNLKKKLYAVMSQHLRHASRSLNLVDTFKIRNEHKVKTLEAQLEESASKLRAQEDISQALQKEVESREQLQRREPISLDTGFTYETTTTETVKPRHKIVEEDPETIQEEHPVVKEEKQTVQEEQQTVQEEPQMVQDVHTMNQEEQQTVQGEQQIVQEEPQMVHDVHSMIQEEQQTVQEDPETVQENPVTIQGEHQTVQENPETIQEKHEMVQECENTPEEKISHWRRRLEEMKESGGILRKGDPFNSEVKVCCFTSKEKESVPEVETLSEMVEEGSDTDLRHEHKLRTLEAQLEESASKLRAQGDIGQALQKQLKELREQLQRRKPISLDTGFTYETTTTETVKPRHEIVEEDPETIQEEHPVDKEEKQTVQEEQQTVQEKPQTVHDVHSMIEEEQQVVQEEQAVQEDPETIQEEHPVDKEEHEENISLWRRFKKMITPKHKRLFKSKRMKKEKEEARVSM
ncbi:golgin subfamily A member 6-like protein 1 isoform X2 [Notolabrus celidotus]|uniref:golgin subfamily A member 6-like protein 1 isoform X2 n=1 Tax=Notolabrus celidotus TaxID=1203425 RepID=UPI00148F506C|nr:golgin subfamily A member 6-like protein 1 isoform X2 [Notolabrus celidotus]